VSRDGIEPPHKVFQTNALPVSYRDLCAYSYPVAEEGGIRTHEIMMITDLQSVAFDRSATSSVPKDHNRPGGGVTKSRVGIEPTTEWLTAIRSTDELPGENHF
jgi:hypothetical protein